MATKRAIGDMRADALKRLDRFFSLIAESENIAPPVMQEFRDLAYQEAAQLKTMADFGEALAIAMGLAEPAPEPEPVVETTEVVYTAVDAPPIPLDREHLAFTPLSKLMGIAKERSIALDPKWNSQDVMEAILASVEAERTPDDTPTAEDLPFDEMNEDGSALDSMTVAELKAYAESEGIDLEGATKKADIIAAIEAAQAAVEG